MLDSRLGFDQRTEGSVFRRGAGLRSSVYSAGLLNPSLIIGAVDGPEVGRHKVFLFAATPPTKQSPLCLRRTDDMERRESGGGGGGGGGEGMRTEAETLQTRTHTWSRGVLSGSTAH